MADMTDAMVAEVEAIIEAQADKPAHQQLVRWAVEADVACAHEGHPRYVDGRCVRCRGYEPEARSSFGDLTPAVAQAGEPCNLYTREQGCPLHGETCAPEYR